MHISLWFSGALIALMLLTAAMRRHRPHVLWRRMAFYASLTFFSAVLIESWRVSGVSATVIDPVRVEAGKKLFARYGCASCHSLGKGLVFGPDLEHVSQRYSRVVIAQWMMSSDEIYRQFGRRPLASGNPDMPNLGVPEADARLIADYLASLDRPGTE